MEKSPSHIQTSRIENPSPLVQPQFTLLVGNGLNHKYWYKSTKKDGFQLSGTIKDHQIYQADYEVAASRFHNIGFALRMESGSTTIDSIKTAKTEKKEELLLKNIQNKGVHFHLASGGFVRFQYPLHRRMAFFTRGELAIGPYATTLAGVNFDGILQGGIDFYFNDWWGITASYGVMGRYGMETVITSIEDESLKAYTGKGPVLFSGAGTVLLVGLKSTYL